MANTKKLRVCPMWAQERTQQRECCAVGVSVRHVFSSWSICKAAEQLQEPSQGPFFGGRFIPLGTVMPGQLDSGGATYAGWLSWGWSAPGDLGGFGGAAEIWLSWCQLSS